MTRSLNRRRRLAAVLSVGAVLFALPGFAQDLLPEEGENPAAEVGNLAAEAEETPTAGQAEPTPQATPRAVLPALVIAPEAQDLTYGDALSASELTGGAAYDAQGVQILGSFAWAWPDYVPGVGTQALSVVFTPSGNDADYYLPVTVDTVVTVRPHECTVVEPPVCVRSLAYGEPIERAGLAGGFAVDEWGSDVPGVFCFADGDLVPDVGTGNALVLFEPNDFYHYSGADCTVAYTCVRSVPEVTAECLELDGGQPLSEAILVGTAVNAQAEEVEGVFTFSLPDVVPPVSGDVYEVVFTPDDTDRYESVTVLVQVVPGREKPFVSAWMRLGEGEEPYAEAIRYRALDAESNHVDGRFVLVGRETASGWIRVLFIPEDLIRYESVEVMILVERALETDGEEEEPAVVRRQALPRKVIPPCWIVPLP